MPSFKDGVVFPKKRDYENANTSSSTSDDTSRKRRKNRKKSASVADGNPILNTPPDNFFVPEDETLTKSLSLAVNSDGLSEPAAGTRQRRDEDEQQAALRLNKMQGAVRILLECIGEDPDREGLLDTPLRYAKALLFLTKGYQADIMEAVNNAIFDEGNTGMVVIRNIDVSSLCEHHLVPFTGKMHIGYIPSGTVIGLSKLPRIAEIFSSRLQVQERLTQQVAHAIMEILKPQGVAVLMEASHLCMVMRGVEKAGATTVTSCMLGCFKRNSTRKEFLDLVGSNR